MTSGASLFAVFRSTYSDLVDAAEVGRHQLDTTATWFERALRARDARPELAVHDVSFTELVADPIGAARAICRVADVAWSPVRATVSDRPRGAAPVRSRSDRAVCAWESNCLP